MNAIAQEDLYGCGVACLASVADVTYKQALKLFINGKNKAMRVGFYCPEFVAALAKKGLNYEWRAIKSPKVKNRIYHEGTIVFIQKSKKYPGGHFLSRGEGMWMDPWINYPDINIKAGFRKRLPEKPIYVVMRQNQKSALKH